MTGGKESSMNEFFWKNELTFAELKAQVQRLKSVARAPTAKALLNGSSPVIVSKTMADGT